MSVQKIDSMHWRIGAEVWAASGFVFANGADDLGAVAFGDGRGEVFAGVALVGDDQLAATQPERQQAQRDVTLFLVGRGEDRGSWVPSGAASKCRRMPQNQRLWLRL